MTYCSDLLVLPETNSEPHAEAPVTPRLIEWHVAQAKSLRALYMRDLFHRFAASCRRTLYPRPAFGIDPLSGSRPGTGAA